MRRVQDQAEEVLMVDAAAAAKHPGSKLKHMVTDGCSSGQAMLRWGCGELKGSPRSPMQMHPTIRDEDWFLRTPTSSYRYQSVPSPEGPLQRSISIASPSCMCTERGASMRKRLLSERAATEHAAAVELLNVEC